MPHKIRGSRTNSDAVEREAGRAPLICCKWLMYCTIAKPKPISATAVRSHDIIVRSRLKRVRTQAKWLSAVTLTSNLPAFAAVRESDMLNALLPTVHVCALTRSGLERRPPATGATKANWICDNSNGSRLIGRSGLPRHWLTEALSRPSTSILAVTIFVGQAAIVKPLATAIFCAPFAV